MVEPGRASTPGAAEPFGRQVSIANPSRVLVRPADQDRLFNIPGTRVLRVDACLRLWHWRLDVERDPAGAGTAECLACEIIRFG